MPEPLTVFAGISALSSVVQAAYAALKAKREFTANDADEVFNKARDDAADVEVEVLQAGHDDAVEALCSKISGCYSAFKSKLVDGSMSTAQAADELNACACSILKAVKQINGGKLPTGLYDSWERHGC